MSNGETPWLPCSIQTRVRQWRRVVSARHASVHLGASLVVAPVRRDWDGSESFVPFDWNCIANAPGNFHNCDIDTRQLYRPLPCFESSCDQSSALDLAGRCIDRLPDRKQSVTHDRAGPWRLAAAPEDLPTRNILSLPLWLTVSSPSIRHRRPSVRPLDPRSLRLARPHRCQLVVVTLIRHHVRSHD